MSGTVLSTQKDLKDASIPVIEKMEDEAICQMGHSKHPDLSDSSPVSEHLAIPPHCAVCTQHLTIKPALNISITECAL